MLNFMRGTLGPSILEVQSALTTVLRDGGHHLFDRGQNELFTFTAVAERKNPCNFSQLQGIVYITTLGTY
jgi:hypothetical protein